MTLYLNSLGIILYRFSHIASTCSAFMTRYHSVRSQYLSCKFEDLRLQLHTEIAIYLALFAILSLCLQGISYIRSKTLMLYR